MVTLDDCRFVANSADYGGALMADAATIVLDGCVLVANSASERGGGIYAGDRAALALQRCTLAYNEGLAVGGIALATMSNLDLQRTIIAFSPVGEAVELRFASTASVSCADLFGNAGGDWTGALAAFVGVDGNLSVDPEFCGDGAEGDVTLAASSPCAAAPDCGRMGAEGVGCAKRGQSDSSLSAIKGLYGGD
jgi:predicted outer membrane repeat protein